MLILIKGDALLIRPPYLKLFMGCQFVNRQYIMMSKRLVPGLFKTNISNVTIILLK